MQTRVRVSVGVCLRRTFAIDKLIYRVDCAGALTAPLLCRFAQLSPTDLRYLWFTKVHRENAEPTVHFACISSMRDDVWVQQPEYAHTHSQPFSPIAIAHHRWCVRMVYYHTIICALQTSAAPPQHTHTHWNTRRRGRRRRTGRPICMIKHIKPNYKRSIPSPVRSGIITVVVSRACSDTASALWLWWCVATY